MKTEDQIVYVVDDDQAMLESLSWLIESEGLKVRAFSDAQTFLNNFKPTPPNCLLLDIRMPGMSGLELQEKLKNQGKTIPIIFITGHGDTPMAIQAMKLGALDFLLKPFRDQALLEAVHKAIELDSKRNIDFNKYGDIGLRINSLTPREKEVMALVVKGKLNKTISAELGIGTKTVEIHRSRIMKKMQAKSLAALVRFVINYEYFLEQRKNEL